MYFEYETPVWSLVMIWSTPSSRNAQVVARSALAGGMGYALFALAAILRSWRRTMKMGRRDLGMVVVGLVALVVLGRSVEVR